MVEFAFSLPLRYKILDGSSKWLLRQVLYAYIPKNLIERPKRGFAIPINEWLRQDLKDWAIDLLDYAKLKNEGYINPNLVQSKLQQHLKGDADNGYHLWTY